MSDFDVLSEYGVMLTAPTDDEPPTVLSVHDDLASARELARQVPDAWISMRTVLVGEWSGTS